MAVDRQSVQTRGKWLVVVFAAACLLAASYGSAAGPLADTRPGEVVSAAVTRIGSSFQLAWSTVGEVVSVSIREGSNPAEIENPIATVNGTSILTVTGLDPSLRHYFRIKGGRGPGVIVAERAVPQLGIVNFRDSGGYPTLPNRGGHSQRVRWGRFFRSGAPGAQSNQGFLSVLDVRTIVDVRAPNEITTSAPQWNSSAAVLRSPIVDENAGSIPDPLTPRLCLPQNVSPSDPSHHYFPFDPVCFADQEAFFGPNGEFFTEFKTAAFRGFASGNGPPGANFGQTVSTALRTTLLALSEPGSLPLVFADSGGAARTGWGAAVVLMALGISEAAILEDYLLTNEFRGPANRAQLDALVGSGRLAKAVYIEPQLFERAEYLQAALAEMRRIYGSFEGYARQALGVTEADLERIRENLLH